MSTAITITHTRGDSFGFYGTVTLNGAAVNITNWTITSQARDAADTVLQAFTVTITDAVNGEYLISATPAQTAEWAPGVYDMDVDYVDAVNFKQSTPKMRLVVRADVTRPIA